MEFQGKRSLAGGVQVELGRMLLRAFRHIDALEGRFAVAMGFGSAAAKPVMAELHQRLAALDADLTPSSASAPAAQQPLSVLRRSRKA